MEVCSTLKASSLNLIAAKLFKLKRWNTHQSVAEMMGYRLICKWITPTSNEWKILIFESPLPLKNQKKIFVEYSNSIQEPNEQVLCPVIRDSIWIYIFVINKQIPSWRGQPASWRERWSTVDTQSAGCKILGNLE